MMNAIGEPRRFDKERIFGLDLLRFIAITTVLIDHGIYFSSRILPCLNSVLLFDGVDLFFVLSGFLIGQIIIRQYTQLSSYSSTVVFSFWKRRWLRTLPAYYVVLCIGLFSLLLINPILYNKPILLNSRLWLRYFIFSQNIFTQHPNFFTVAWSLAVEEWFYFTIPILLFLLDKTLKQAFSSRRILLSLFVIGVFTITMLRYINYHYSTLVTYSNWDSTVRKVVLYRLDSILFGCIAAYWHFFYFTSWQKLATIAFATGCLVLAIMCWYTVHMNYTSLSLLFYVFSFTVNGIGIMLLLPYLSQLTLVNRPYWSRLITTVSVTSYSIYLLHDFLVLTLLKKIHNRYTYPALGEAMTDCLFFVSYLVLSYMGAVILYQMIERPFMAIRQREL